MMKLEASVDSIETRQEFVSFLGRLLESLTERPGDWENSDLAAFLSAMEAWVEDMEGYYENRAEPVPGQPSWKTLAQILLAARIYE